MREKFFYLSLIKSLVIALFIILVVAQAGKKFVLDEIDFPAVAYATSETGVPVYYRGEENQKHIGIYHPPLYIYSLAGFVKAFGYSEKTIRMFGALCTLVTAFLSILIVAKLFPNKNEEQYFPLIFLPLFLIHPYTLANTTLPDIDQTVLPITILLFIYFLLKKFPSQKLTESSSIQTASQALAVLTLSILFALNLWTKMTTPLALLPTAFFILMVLGYALRRSLAIVALIAIFGTVWFLTSYWIYCHYFDLPFEYTFQFLVHSFTKGTSGAGSFSATLEKILVNISYLKQFANWLTVPFIFVLFLSLAYLTAKKNKSESEKILMVLSLFGVFVSIFYLSLIAPFGRFFKYPYPVFSLVVLPIAYFLTSHLFSAQLEEKLETIKRRRWLTIETQNMALGVIFVLVFIPTALNQLFLAKDLAILADHPISFYMLFSVSSVAILLGTLSQRAGLQKLFKYSAPAMLAVLLGSQLGISRSQAVAEYPTKYEYGQTGMNETVAYLKSHVAPAEVIWSMKDVGYYVNNKYIENYGYIFDPSLESKLADIIRTKHVRYFVVTQGIGQDRVDAYPTLKRSLDSCCIIDQEFGNFVIYKAKIQ